MEKIAAALSITPPTLRKNYFRELKSKEEARFRVEAKLIDALMGEVEKGNVSAIDKYMKRFEKHDRDQAAYSAAHRGTSHHVPSVGAAKSPKLGKKEAARQAAGEYTGLFAPPEGPLN